MNKEPIMNDIDRLTSVVHAEHMKNEYADTMKDIEKKKEDMLGVLDGISSDKDIITEKLEKWSLEDLKKYIYASEENTNSFFLNENTGEYFHIDTKFDNKKRELEFKRELLILLKSSDETWKNCDAAEKQLDADIEEFNVSVKEATTILSDNVLTYISHTMDKAQAMPDGPEKKAAIKALEAEKAGYTMEYYKTTFLKYPSSIESCKKDISSDVRIASIGKRYIAKLNSSRTKASLIPFLSNDGPSFEECVFTKDEYTTKDLFVFSLIRYFSMADWNDANTKRMHAVTCLYIKRIMQNDELEDEVKIELKQNILDYMSIFK